MQTLKHVGAALSFALALGWASNAAAQGAPAEAPKKPDGIDLRVFWKEGMNFESEDKSIKLKIGGRIHHDWSFCKAGDDIEDAHGAIEDGTEFRRARLSISGEVYKNIEFKWQYDFAVGPAEFKDMYVGLKGIPVLGGFRVGQFHEPFGLEEMTTSNVNSFMERSLTSAFVPSRRAGGMFHNHVGEANLTWALGVFRSTNDQGLEQAEGEYNITGRVAGTPIWKDDGKTMLHVGLAASRRSITGDSTRFRQRPSAHLSPRFVDTGNFDADGANLFGTELACVFDSFSAQAEYMQDFVEGVPGENPTFNGFYGMMSYFLTGENRKYKQSSGLFERIKPKANFDGKGEWGAWELAVRYSRLDLDDQDIRGGELQDITVGLNWHLNPNTRVMCNYVWADESEVGDANFLLFRFQFEF